MAYHGFADTITPFAASRQKPVGKGTIMGRKVIGNTFYPSVQKVSYCGPLFKCEC